MTSVEIQAYNAGIQAVLAIAARTADAILRTSKRRVHEDFAVAALVELAEAGKALLVSIPSEPKEVARG